MSVSSLSSAIFEHDFARDPRLSRTWAEVDLRILAANVAALNRRAARNAGENGIVMAVLKADGYGHGAIPLATLCAAQGVTHFGVASVAEAQELRRAGIGGNLYLLSAFLPEEAEIIVREELIPFLSSPEQAHALARAAANAPLPARSFLTVDTGMGREGCLPEIALDLWRDFADSAALRFSGIATHLSSADEDEWLSPTQTQTQAFSAFLAALGSDALINAHDGRGGKGVYLSVCNSPATLRLPPFAVPPGVRGVLFRTGLLLCGIAPYRAAPDDEPEIRPILSWRARINLLRDLPVGAAIGYGRTHTLTRPSRIATVAVGYADGLSRRLSNAGRLLLQNHRFPLVGRVSMDQCQIDVTDAPSAVHIGDVVTIIGADGSETQTAFDLAAQLETTPHEPTCALTLRVPRLYVTSQEENRAVS